LEGSKVRVEKKNSHKIKRVKGQQPNKVDWYNVRLTRVKNRMKKHNPSYGQNGQLVHWWELVHSSHKFYYQILSKYLIVLKNEFKIRNLNISEF
jgi:hypothetical protein